jgi:nucleoid-associated protein YgaU
MAGPKISIFLPFEALGRVVGGTIRAVGDGVHVVADALSPQDIPPPATVSNVQVLPEEQPVPPAPGPEEREVDPPRAQRPMAHAYREYTVQPGEYLVDIAARELGRAARWPEIAALNQIEDTRNVKAGQTLLLPD